MSTKEIARQTGLTPSTVDTYLKQAISAFGAGNRRDAARSFARMEASQKSGPALPALPIPCSSSPEDEATGDSNQRYWLRLPPVGGSDNDLNWQHKTVHILQVSVLSAAVVLALTLTIAGFLRLIG